MYLIVLNKIQPELDLMYQIQLEEDNLVEICQ